MTDLDNLKAMLTKAEVKFEQSNADWADEIDIEFQLEWMTEAVMFTFDSQGELKEVL